MAIPGTNTRNKIATGGPSAANINRFPLEVADQLFMQGGNIAALTLMSRKNKKAVGNKSYTILEDGRRSRTDTTNGGTLTAGTVTLTLTNAARWRIYDIWKNIRTGEQVLCTGTPSSTTRTVVRGYDAAAAGTGIALTNGDKWMRIGNAMPEGGSAVIPLVTNVESRTNYLQQADETTRITEIMQNTNVFAKPEVSRQRDNTKDEIIISVESSFWWGKPLIDVEGASPLDATPSIDTRTLTGGLKHWIDTDASSNAFSVGGSLSLLDLWDIVSITTRNDMMRTDKDSPDLILVGGSRALSVLNTFALNAIETKPGDSMFGLHTKRIHTAFGNLELCYNRLFDDYYGDGTNAGNAFFLVNPKYVGYRHLNNMDIRMRVLENPERPDTNGNHQTKEEFYGYIGFHCANANLHSYVEDVNFASV